MTQTDWQDYREIILIRHPETKDRGHGELSTYGKEQARLIAHGLIAEDRVPDVVITSPPVRAAHAGGILVAEFSLAGQHVNLRQSGSLEIRQTRSSGILAEVSALSDEKRRVAFVGSKAYLGDALFLLGSIPDASFEDYGKTIVLQSNALTWKDFTARDDATVINQFHPEMVAERPHCAAKFLRIASAPRPHSH